MQAQWIERCVEREEVIRGGYPRPDRVREKATCALWGPAEIAFHSPPDECAREQAGGNARPVAAVIWQKGEHGSPGEKNQSGTAEARLCRYRSDGAFFY